MTNFSNLKIALVSDSLTRECLSLETKVFNVTPWNYVIGLKLWKPDILLVESTWNGYLNSWKFKVASYEKRKKNHILKNIVRYSQDLNIPTVFWNKEDSVHFERFIDSASLFENVLTVDSNCIDRYHEHINKSIKVGTLMFAVQPKIHSFNGMSYAYKKACFVGSYNHHEHYKRREWQDMLFSSSNQFGLDIYDRNSNKKADTFKFPENLGDNIQIKKGVSHDKTGDIYRNYIACLNINTVTNSPSMFSRRLIEIIACGRIAITNPSDSVSLHFSEYCDIITNKEELEEAYSRLNNGYDKSTKERLKEGSLNILNHYSYNKRIEEILHFINK